MIVLKSLVFFVCTIISFSESKFVDTLTKCSIKDGACQRGLVSKALKSIHLTGVPELGIPPIDPFEFEDVIVTVLELVELKAIEGKAFGVSNCVVDNFETEIDRGYSKMKLTCNALNIKARYKLSANSAILRNLFGGGPIHGEGNGKVNIESIEINFHYYYDVQKNKDGDPFFDCKLNTTQYEYKILGKVTFAADNIFIGRMEVSDLAVDLLNVNYKFVMDTFGKPFMDKAMALVYLYTHKFFDVVPAKYFIIEDMSKYVKD